MSPAPVENSSITKFLDTSTSQAPIGAATRESLRAAGMSEAGLGQLTSGMLITGKPDRLIVQRIAVGALTARSRPLG